MATITAARAAQVPAKQGAPGERHLKPQTVRKRQETEAAAVAATTPEAPHTPMVERVALEHSGPPLWGLPQGPAAAVAALQTTAEQVLPEEWAARTAVARAEAVRHPVQLRPVARASLYSRTMPRPLLVTPLCCYCFEVCVCLPNSPPLTPLLASSKLL